MAVVRRLIAGDVMSTRPCELKLSALPFIIGTDIIEVEIVLSETTVKAVGVTRAERGNNLHISLDF